MCSISTVEMKMLRPFESCWRPVVKGTRWRQVRWTRPESVASSTSKHGRYTCRTSLAVTYSSTISTQRVLRLSRLSRLPASLSVHPLSSCYSPTPSHSPLVTALSSASSSVQSLRSRPLGRAPIACSVAFFCWGDAMPFWSDIPCNRRFILGGGMRCERGGLCESEGAKLRCRWRGIGIGREFELVEFLATRR
jgi:hypothetical protein